MTIWLKTNSDTLTWGTFYSVFTVFFLFIFHAYNNNLFFGFFSLPESWWTTRSILATTISHWTAWTRTRLARIPFHYCAGRISIRWIRESEHSSVVLLVLTKWQKQKKCLSIIMNLFLRYNLFYNGRPILAAPVDLIPATFYTLTLQRNGNKMVKLRYFNITLIRSLQRFLK